jgi:hypothetical protein
VSNDRRISDSNTDDCIGGFMVVFIASELRLLLHGLLNDLGTSQAGEKNL